MKFLKNKQYAAAVAFCVIALALAGWRLVGDAPRAIDLAVFVVFGVALLWLPVIDMAGQILRKLGEQTRTSVNVTSMGVSASWPAARTHRQELELALAGRIGDLAYFPPKQAGENVKTMVDAILALDSPPMPSPDEQVAESALRQVLSIVQSYLPPDGISIDEAMNQIIAIVDPFPVSRKVTSIDLPVVDPGPDALEREIQAKASVGPSPAG